MDALKYLREAVKSYFPASRELQLASTNANLRRFNFYFEIDTGNRFLLYLNWDGDDDRFTFKCLEFADPEKLNTLILRYPEIGTKTFNIGKPRSAVSFLYLKDKVLSALEFKGVINSDHQSSEINGRQLMEYIDPFAVLKI